MDAKSFSDIPIGAAVVVYSFGVHRGHVVEKNPTVTIQGRTFKADGWLKVQLEGGKPEWNGTYRDVERDVCRNAEPGTFNHECGKPATWTGTRANGSVMRFCDHCKMHGYEATGFIAWERTAQ